MSCHASRRMSSSILLRVSGPGLASAESSGASGLELTHVQGRTVSGSLPLSTCLLKSPRAVLPWGSFVFFRCSSACHPKGSGDEVVGEDDGVLPEADVHLPPCVLESSGAARHGGCRFA
jgi:hypothetical protein